MKMHDNKPAGNPLGSPLGAPAKMPAFLESAGRDAGAPSGAHTEEAGKDAGGPGGEPRQWHSRGYLPHLDYPGLIQLITFRLADSMPVEVVQKWRDELGWCMDMKADNPAVIELEKRIERYENAGYGACWLRQQRIAELVETALLFFDGERYRIISWCIMPNHVHVLVETKKGFPLSGVLQSWKSYTALQANKLLARRGTFWMHEYRDRYIRDQAHFDRTLSYIEENPVKAHLVRNVADWRWSSAYRKTGETLLGAPASLPADLINAAKDGGVCSEDAGRDAGAPSK